MGWYERLSGSDKPSGARSASGIESREIEHWREENKKPLESSESLGWEGHLLTGYHIQKVKKDESTEYVKLHAKGSPSKLNTSINTNK